MTEQDERKLQEEYGDILAALGEVRRRIDAHTYHGRPWRAPRRGRRLVLSAVAAAAAAAVLILALGAHWTLTGSDPHPVQSDSSAEAPDGSARYGGEWTVPSGIGLSLSGGVSLDIPSVSIPSAELFGRIEWDVPSITFPFTEERSDENESKDETDNPAGRRGGRDVDHIADAWRPAAAEAGRTCT